jgi:hypothetical protein
MRGHARQDPDIALLIRATSHNIQPDGQINSDFQKSCQAKNYQESKIFRFIRRANQGHIFGHPVLVRRASAVVTDVGRVAMDADVAKTNAAEAYGKSVWS